MRKTFYGEKKQISGHAVEPCRDGGERKRMERAPWLKVERSSSKPDKKKDNSRKRREGIPSSARNDRGGETAEGPKERLNTLLGGGKDRESGRDGGDSRKRREGTPERGWKGTLCKKVRGAQKT